MMRLVLSAATLELANPLSEEASVMRTSLVPSMLDMLAWNLNRNTENVRLFEASHVYEKDGEKSDRAEACLSGRDRQRS